MHLHLEAADYLLIRFNLIALFVIADHARYKRQIESLLSLSNGPRANSSPYHEVFSIIF